MLTIEYVEGNGTRTATYAKASDFVDAQEKEVPDLADNFAVTQAEVDGKPVVLAEKTIHGLYVALAK